MSYNEMLWDEMLEAENARDYHIELAQILGSSTVGFWAHMQIASEYDNLANIAYDELSFSTDEFSFWENAS